MYRYKNLHFRFSADTCTSTFVTANIFPWYLLIRENFANGAVQIPEQEKVAPVREYATAYDVAAPQSSNTLPSTSSWGASLTLFFYYSVTNCDESLKCPKGYIRKRLPKKLYRFFRYRY